ncbi:hypothetical protein [Edaphobacter albus]|nr:hypothetical protein [Edaphobacter sp. 4G125]
MNVTFWEPYLVTLLHRQKGALKTERVNLFDGTIKREIVTKS